MALLGLGMRLKVLSLLLAAGLLPFSSAQAGFETSHVEISTPTSAWLVGPSLVADTDATRGLHVPCIMVNQFSSGHSVRFSAGGEKVYAIAIDYRQRLFNKAELYDVELGVGNSFDAVVSALAYNTDTLLISMQGFPDFYDALKTSKTMFIKHGDDVVDLALAGVPEGLERVEACYSDSVKNSSAQAAAPSASQGGLGDITPMPGEVGASADASATAAVPSVAPMMPQVEDSVEEHQQEVDALIDDLLQVSADTPKTGSVDKIVKGGPVAVTGGRLARTWASPDLQDTLPAPAAPPRANEHARVPQSDPVANQVRTWRAIRGSSLREIIDVWAQKENVRVVWMAGEEFTIQESMSVQGKFEDAILTVLNQFGEENARPVGKIYVDPQFNQKVLLVEAKKNF